MLLTLKGTDGGTVVVNTDHILYIGPATDGQSKNPLLGYSNVALSGGFALLADGRMVQPSIVVRGTPNEIAEMIRLREV